MPVEHALVDCADQEMSGGRRKYRGDRAGFGILRSNLAETMPIKGQQSILRGGDHELRFPAVRQQSRSKSDERRRWQVSAGDELPGGSATKMEFQKATRSSHVEMILK